MKYPLVGGGEPGALLRVRGGGAGAGDVFNFPTLDFAMNTESKKPLRTQDHLALLLNCRSYPRAVGPETEKPIYMDLVKSGLVEQATVDRENVMRITPLGVALVESILALPVPTLPQPPKELTPAQKDEKYCEELLKTGMAYTWHPSVIAKGARHHMRCELWSLMEELRRNHTVCDITVPLAAVNALRRALELPEIEA